MARTPNKLFKRVESVLKDFSQAVGEPAPESVSALLLAVSRGESVEPHLEAYESWRESRDATIAEREAVALAAKKAAQEAKRAAKSFI
jgi:hypothetical protein